MADVDRKALSEVLQQGMQQLRSVHHDPLGLEAVPAHGMTLLRAAKPQCRIVLTLPCTIGRQIPRNHASRNCAIDSFERSELHKHYIDV